MLGKRITVVLAILSLLVIGIHGLPSDEETRRCPRGMPVSRDCDPRTFPNKCPSGYHCYNSTDASGLCCPDSAKVTCPSGGNPAGPCSPNEAHQCPPGHFCSSTSVDGSGTCCPLNVQMVPPKCQNGGIPNGRCVPSVTNQCAGGFFCQEVPGDRTGHCCPTRIVQPPLGSCPLVTNTGCKKMSDQCLSDDVCRQGQRCCTDGCRRVCTYVNGGSYVPGSDLRGVTLI